MKTYKLHKDVWMPDKLKEQVKKLQRHVKPDRLNLSRHIQEHLATIDNKHNYTYDDLWNVACKLENEPIEPFEITINKGDDGVLRIEKYAIRTNLKNGKDIAVSISITGKLITAWINHEKDKHFTLDTTQYYKGWE